MISTYEVGRIRLQPGVLLQLADVLDVSVDEILGRTQKKQTKTHDQRLWNRFLLLARLPERDQKAVMRMIRSLAAASGVKESSAKRQSPSPAVRMPGAPGFVEADLLWTSSSLMDVSHGKGYEDLAGRRSRDRVI